MTGAQLLIRCLEQEGVRYVFGVPGEETLDLNDALLDSSIRFVPVRHEQAAAFMADLWGRLTGRAGVCLATLGPDEPHHGSRRREPRPGPRRGHHRSAGPRPPPQGVPPVRGHRGGVPALHEVEHPDRDRRGGPRGRPEGIQDRPGGEARACHLELPEDVAGDPAEGAPLRVYQPRRPSPDRPSLARAADIMNRADRPLILAGNGVIRGHAGRELRVLAERVQIPVVTTFMAKGALPADHPLMVTTVGLVAEDIERAGFTKADVVVTVGYDLVEYAPSRWNPSGHARLVHIDFTAAEVDARYQPDVEVVADVREALELLAPLVGVRPHAKPPTPRTADPRRRADAFPLFPQRVMADLEAVLAPEDLVVSDVGAHKLWVAKAYGARLPNTVIVSNGFAAMGIGLPGAIAAKLAQPERRVVTVTGDGGFLMNVQELETARRLSLAFVVLIMRDDGYGVIRWKQQKRFGRTAGVDLGNPDFVVLAESFGCLGLRVESSGGLRPALETALVSGVPTVVDCPVDYAENDRLTEH